MYFNNNKILFAYLIKNNQNIYKMIESLKEKVDNFNKNFTSVLDTVSEKEKKIITEIEEKGLTQFIQDSSFTKILEQLKGSKEDFLDYLKKLGEFVDDELEQDRLKKTKIDVKDQLLGFIKDAEFGVLLAKFKPKVISMIDENFNEIWSRIKKVFRNNKLFK